MTAPRIILAKYPRHGFDGIWLGAIWFTIDAFRCDTIKLRPQPWRLAAALIAAAPYVISHKDLFDHLYSGRKDGGPFDLTLRNHIYWTRRALSVIGIKIVVHGLQGWSAILPDIEQALVA